jgi:ACR3 family arsenite transporter
MKFVELIRKYLPLWVATAISLALFVGYYYPKVKALTLAIPFFLFLMLYPMMIVLRVEDIGKAVKDLRLSFMGIFMNFLLSPPLGALWAYLIFRHLDPYISTGFILKIAVPCGGMVAAWTGYAKGKVESALIIMALSLILAIFLVPLWMWALARVYVQIDPFMIFQKMLIIIVLPLIAGIITRKSLVRKYGMNRYKSIAPFFPAASTCGMLLMVFTIISTGARLIVSNYHWVFLVILGIATLYPCLFILVILFSKVAHIDHGNCMALGYSVTAKNHAITIGVATTTFGGSLAVLPAAVAPVIQIPMMLLFLNLSGRIKRFLHPE